jgi:hypothetical protein
VTFAAGEQEVSVLLHNRPAATARDDWDRDVLTATIAATTGAFRGSLATVLWTHEIAAVRQLLVDLHQHVGQERRAAFVTSELALGLTFRRSRLGHLHVDVQLRTDIGLESEALLAFSLAADQSHLPTWIAALTHALEVFPPATHSPITPPDDHRK